MPRREWPARPDLDEAIKRDLEIKTNWPVCQWLQENGGLLVLTDFDGCLTIKYTDGNVTTLMELVRARLYRDERALYERLMSARNYQQEIRGDYRVCEYHKQKWVKKVWQQSLMELCHSRVITEEYLEEIGWSAAQNLRVGMAAWLQHLQELGATIVIYSASLVGQNLIPQVLDHHGINPTRQIKILSNGLKWGPKGAWPLQLPTVTPINKNSGYVRWVVGKMPRHCLLIGDTIGDLRPAEGLGCETIKTIGFAGDREMPSYSAYFDYAIYADSEWPHVFKI